MQIAKSQFGRVLKWLLMILAAVAVLVAISAVVFWPSYAYVSTASPDFKVKRLSAQPMIHAGLDKSLQAENTAAGYANFTGPSLIRVPDWLPNPLGRYYLYFAHHQGSYIRLAYANKLSGPWKIYAPGTLTLEQSQFPVSLEQATPGKALGDLWKYFSPYVFRDYLIMAHRTRKIDAQIRIDQGLSADQGYAPHIASPDVIVDNENKQLLMFFHGQGDRGYQFSRQAVSTDGIHFNTVEEPLIPSSHVRYFNYRDHDYLLGMPGVLFRKHRDDTRYYPRDTLLFDPDMRHNAVWVEGDELHVLWSRVGDAPESLLYSTIDMTADDWSHWKTSVPAIVMPPRQKWEGKDLPELPSFRGEVDHQANDIRDPAVFLDKNGKRYLVYVGGGERAIGIAELIAKPKNLSN